MQKIEKLLKKGVRIPSPGGVEIGDDVDIERIAGKDVTFHSGCKIFGKSTLILPGVKLGYEGPVTVENCWIGPDVSLKGGFFKEAVFLEGANAGLGAHVRQGTILEEQANIAHTVALKQSILFPFVTLGSLINFCDVFMAGGTSRKNHSEVGSSYIHFNFTPNQDKATPSQIGDVPQGVMLNQRPVFLGGQGGLVGPCRLAFGTLIAAGTIYRKDETRPDRLLIGGGTRPGSLPFTPGIYRSVKRIVYNNILYIANLAALDQWYRHVRRQFISPRFPAALHEGLIQALGSAVKERIQRLDDLAAKMPESVSLYEAGAGDNASGRLIEQKMALYRLRSAIRSYLESAMKKDGDQRARDAFLEAVVAKSNENGKDYLASIQSLDPADAAAGTHWLQQIVTRITQGATRLLPSIF